MSATILIIEDNMNFANALKIKVKEEGIRASVRIEGFKTGMEQLSNIMPDILVLDLYEGSISEGKREGVPIFQEQVWGRCFTPVIFASASPEQDIIEFSRTHPLLNYIVKGKEETIEEIVENIKSFLPFGIGIKGIKTTLLSDTDEITQKALTQTAKHIISGALNSREQIPLLENAARRRLGALMRLKSEQELKPIFAWEQYLYPPPVTTHLLTGDVLFLSTGDRHNPESYRVVFTPSCDMAQCNVEYVLVGKCVSIQHFCDKNNLPSLTSIEKRRKAKDKLKTMLNQAQSSGFAVLPAFSNLIPLMAVSLRDLELLSVRDGIRVLSTDEGEFERVVSIDSPHREQLAWAYLEIACRPGMPIRDTGTLTEEILSLLPDKTKK